MCFVPYNKICIIKIYEKSKYLSYIILNNKEKKMKAKDIEDILDTFVKKENRDISILIDGPWGIGKTYCINNFLKTNALKNKVRKEKKKKIVYISLFGKKSIKAIDTELYNIAHKKFKITTKATQLTTRIVGAFPGAPDFSESLDFALRNFLTAKVKDKIVIFDDLERIGMDSYLPLLGYFNQLFLNNICVICIMNSERFLSEDNNVYKDKGKSFLEFKEKIFDKQYIINKCDSEIIKKLFKENDSILKQDSVIKELRKNLRLVKRTSEFLSEIYKIVENNNLKLSRKRCSNNIINWYSTLLIVGTNTDNYKKAKKSERINDYLYEKDGKKKVDLLFQIIDYEAENKCSYSVDNNYAILSVLYDLYFYDDESNFKNYFKETKYANNGNPFYLNEKGKENFCNKTYLELMKLNEIDSDSFNSAKYLFLYEKSNAKLENVQNKFIDLISVNKKISDYLGDTQLLEECKRYNDFIKKLANSQREKACSKICKGIKNIYGLEDMEALEIEFDKIRNNSLYWDPLEDKNIHSTILKFFRENNFFVPDFSKDLNPFKWHSCLALTTLAKRKNFSKEFTTYLKNICKPGEEGFDKLDILLKNLM